MSKVSPLQGNFNTGEVSPLLFGRVDQERYASSLAKCLNYIPTIQGGLIRRSGTIFVSEVKFSSRYTRLVRFEFSVTQAYVIEFGHHYFRFYKDNSIITISDLAVTAITKASVAVVTSAAHGFSNGDRIILTDVNGMTEVNNREFIVASVATNTFELKDVNGVNVNSTGFTTYTSGGLASEVYEIATPYDELDLFQLKFTQSADVLYIVHPAYEPRSLSRTGHTNWTLSVMSFLDGPFLNQNTTSTTLTPSAFTGTGVTLTASSVVGINNDTGFKSTDVGRSIRLKEGTISGYVVVTGYTSPTVVTVTCISSIINTNPKALWRMGVWSGTTGYPSCVIFYEDRLFFAGVPDFPQRLDGSRSGDYQNFSPSDADGTITASHALGFVLNSNDVQAIQWMTSDEKGLLVGTVKAEWVVRASSPDEALTPVNITAKQATNYGSANVQPVQADKATIFIQRSSRKIRELIYFYDVAGFKAPDLTILSEHITETGLVELAFQREPQSVIWCVRNDGVLAAMSYERDLDALRVGWARHIAGGSSDAIGSQALVESVAVIPSVDATHDDPWIIVQREINGQTKRYVEYITKTFDDQTDQRDAYFVDGGLTYDNPFRIVAATHANPAVITTDSPHGFSNGDTVLILGTSGMDEINNEEFTVGGVTSTTFQLSGINSSAFSPYISGGYARKYVTTISNLNHLEGEIVSVLADGAVQPVKAVTNGKITLSAPAATVQIGFGFNSDAQMVRLEAGARDGTALGKKRRTHHVGFLVHRTLGMQLGLNFDEMTTLTFRTSSEPMSRAPELYSGIISETIDADYDYENQVCWRQSQPLPSLILAVMPQLVTQDNG